MKPTSPHLDVLRARVRHGQLVIGLGLASAVGGAILVSSLIVRLQPWLAAIGAGVPGAILLALVQRLWVVALLPLLCYAAARVSELRPWPTAIASASTGEILYLGLDLATVGFEGLTHMLPWLLVRLGTLVAGILLARWAVTRARAAAARAQEAAQAVARGNQAEYEELAREAERIASRAEERAASATPETPHADPPRTDER